MNSDISASAAAFVPPVPIRLPKAKPVACHQGVRATRCKVSTKRYAARRRRNVSYQSSGLEEHPTTFLSELRRLVRSPYFISRVRERINWPYFRFSGVLFARTSLENEEQSDGDGVPFSLRDLVKRVDMVLVDVPPLLVQRAASNSKLALDSQKARIVAVFETYGHTRKALETSQNQQSQFENDLQKQRLAWSDHGNSLRTETKIMPPHGAELFEEDYLDYYL